MLSPRQSSNPCDPNKNPQISFAGWLVGWVFVINKMTLKSSWKKKMGENI